jgi:endonuclease G
VVPLPRLSAAQKLQAAANLAAGPGEHPHALRYRHYSVVMNGERRLAFFTASNIDGATAKLVDRKTKAVRPLTVGDLDGESLGDSGAEAEDWLEDPRILDVQQAGTRVYEKQKVPGFPNPQEPGRIARMFQKGHMVRRIDPAWGDDATALEGEADSFFYTNAVPQVGFFNQGTAAATLPASAGGNLWRAVEDAVLRNAVADKSRVICFTAPILTATDLPFRGIRVPKRFFKVAVWVDTGRLKSFAMIADQSVVIEVMPEGLDAAAELQKVKDFATTIARVERDSGLNFGAAVRNADVRRGLPEAADTLTDGAAASEIFRRKGG